MLSRLEPILRIACIILAALVLVQLLRVARKEHTIDQLSIPEVPTWSTNAVTNAVANVATNAAIATVTNASTNSIANVATNSATNILTAQKIGDTNAVTATNATNIAQLKVAVAETNSVAIKPMEQKATSSPASPLPPGAMPSGFRTATPKKGSDLAPAIQVRVDKITQSEILAQVVRPAPMALLGIGGEFAFLRGTNGQTGVVKEGEEVGGIKLLKIGVNRVLVEENGEKKELMIFAGSGGESLLAKEKEKQELPNETKTHR